MNNTQQRSNWFERSPRLTLFAVIVIGLALILLVLEAVSSQLFPEWGFPSAEQGELWEYDSLLGWVHRAGYRGRFTGGSFSVDVSINADGMRDDLYPVERTEKKRMLVIGDSFTWGWGVNPQQRFTEVLERRHPDWEIINASVAGYGTDQEYLYLRERGLNYRPDVVLLLFFDNDFTNNSYDVQYAHNKPVFEVENGLLVRHNVPVPRSGIGQALGHFIERNTYFLAKVYSTLRELYNRYEIPKPLNYPVTAKLLSAINDVSGRHGARFLLVSVPMAPDRVEFLENVAREAGFPFLPLDEEFAKVRETVEFAQDGHWNPRGQEITAHAIERFLQRTGVFAAPDAPGDPSG